MKIEQVIEEKYKTLTKSEKKIANYVLESPNHIIYGTMNDIKSEIHVGDATIIRFCQKLGFSGFSDLKIEIAKEDYSQKESQAKDSELFFDEKERKIVNSLETTKRKLSIELLERSSALLSNASAIYIFGVGLSGITAKDLEAMFLRIGIQAKAISDNHFQAQTAAILKNTDLVIGISLSGRTLDLYESLKIAKGHTAKILSITSNLVSPIAQLSDIVLQTTAEEFFDGGSLSGKISQLYICELLVRHHEKIFENEALKSREEIIRAVISKSID
ncbi:RpiR family transcriptional regulator [Lactococcus lactis RTB018]|nr:MurR/RpiR family transcriptional regulator [Lactococcus lactis]OAZ17121.1 RpiR family transcriptional regulator [Lactococcus lactis RTB018]